MHMLHHISLAVTDIERSAKFYDETLKTLGYVRVFGESDQAVGYGLAGEGDKFCIKLDSTPSAATEYGFHLAFAAPSREAVNKFHGSALLHGGTDNGGPGPRPD